MRLLNYIAGKFEFIYFNHLNTQLDFARSVGKRLDEHREVVESITENTTLFKDKFWHICHMATQDDYLMRLYFLRHETWPIVGQCPATGEYVRARPKVLGECGLPEYPSERTDK